MKTQKKLLIYLKVQSIEVIILNQNNSIEFYKKKEQICSHKLKYKKLLGKLFQEYSFNKTVVCFEQSLSQFDIENILAKLGKKNITFDASYKEIYFISKYLKNIKKSNLKKLDFSIDGFDNGWINLNDNKNLVLNAMVKYYFYKS